MKKQPTKPTPIASVPAPVVAPVVAARTIVLTRRTTPRKGSGVIYTLAGLRATARFARSAFTTPPDSMTVSAVGFADPTTPW